MELIEDISELRRNLSIFEAYRYSLKTEEKSFQLERIEKGKIFIAHMSAGRYIFAPSRFIGYKNNTFEKHINNKMKDGTKTTPIINEMLGFESFVDEDLEAHYQKYCTEFEVNPDKIVRKFWKLKVEKK